MFQILVVEDDASLRRLMVAALKQNGYEAFTANDGVEALDVLEKTNIDLIISDIMMPNMNGEKAFEELRKLEGFDVPTIALTADAVAGAQEHYKEVGFFDYLAKPFNREQIKEKLDILFK